MATIKSFTDISQSKVLAEVLPLESADMHYVLIDTDEDKYAAGLGKYIGILPHYPCWSLAALLDILKYPELVQSISEKWSIADWSGKHPKIMYEKDTPIDACYEMILKLHELKML